MWIAPLYWLLPDADWSPTFLASGYQSAFLKFKQQPQILAALRQLILKRAPSGSHVHRTLQLWRDGLSLNNNTPITHLDQYLELREVCSLIREGSNSTLFTECAESAIDYRFGRVPATLCYDARFPTRTQQFSAQELRHILSQLHRPSVLRVQHFCRFGTDPNYAQWLTQAMDLIVQRLLPAPPPQSLDADSISSLLQSTISSTTSKLPSDKSTSPTSLTPSSSPSTTNGNRSSSRGGPTYASGSPPPNDHKTFILCPPPPPGRARSPC